MLPSAEPEATVVVCEDDPPTLDLLCDHLHADRFEALAAPSAADALRLCHYNDPDLLLLDIRLPDASGLDVLREIRASAGPTGRFDPVLPVIVLSGRSTDVDRVRGFSEGADDYVVKPFHYQEVAARIRAVLRRRDARREGPRRIGDLFIDPSRRKVRVADREVALANKELSLTPHRQATFSRFANGVLTGAFERLPDTGDPQFGFVQIRECLLGRHCAEP
jgi:DNA-binding response OmpR family regulator